MLDHLKERRKAHVEERAACLERATLLAGAIAELNDDIRNIEVGLEAADSIEKCLSVFWP